MPINAQAGIDGLFKEKYQYIALVKMLELIPKPSKMITNPESTSELVRAAFKSYQEDQPRAYYLVCSRRHFRYGGTPK
ncbi:hypothetical protein ACJJIX_01685 [Microbulbifer sp. VAAC004]|uniref:hypothetical protein n=1 Tax=unclassified Microbulbifer TaxID=2619833 RepID=UPI00403A4986